MVIHVYLLKLVTEKQKPPVKVRSVHVATCRPKREIPEERKQATLRMARKELSADSFLAVMRPSSVSQPYYLVSFLFCCVSLELATCISSSDSTCKTI